MVEGIYIVTAFWRFGSHVAGITKHLPECLGSDSLLGKLEVKAYNGYRLTLVGLHVQLTIWKRWDEMGIMSGEERSV